MQVQKPRQGYKLAKSLFGKYEEIPEWWKRSSLSEFGELNAGGTPSTFKKEYWENGTIPWVSSGEIRNNKIITSNETITKLGLENSAAKLFPKGSVFVAITGFGTTRGRSSLLEIDAATNQSVIGIIPKKDRMDGAFLWYALQKQYWTLRNFAQGTQQPGLNLEIVRSFSIIHPSDIYEQQKIASVLSNVDSLIQQTQKIIEQTRRLRKGLMQRLLTKGIRHSKFKEVNIGFRYMKEMIPEEWNYGRIIDNSTLKGRIGWQGLTTAEYRRQGEFYLVTGTDFKNGRIDWKNCVYVDEERYFQDTNIQLKKEDVLVTKDGTIGKIAYIDTIPLPATLNSGVFVTRPVNKEYLPLFLFYILYSNYFMKFLNRLKAGSTINHLYQKDFVNFYFPIPPLPEQQKIASILSNVDSLIQVQQKHKSKLENHKKGLMQKLLTGQIRVKA